MRVAISRCLLGQPVRYDGGSKPVPEVMSLAGRSTYALCALKEYAELPRPRPPAEQREGRVFLSDGRDVTAEFARGSDACRDRALRSRVSLAVSRQKEPVMRGESHLRWDLFRYAHRRGRPLAARLKKEGICVVTEDVVKACKPSVENPVAIVLGTGLGHLGSLVKPVRRIDYHDIEGFPAAANPVSGHVFEATVGTIDDVPVVVYPGRIHLYQGFSAAEVTALVRHAHRLGCRDIIFACATGAVPGCAHTGLGILTDQINLTGRNPLAEWEELRDVETPFVDMNDAYSPYLRTVARGVADDLGVAVEEGVYAGVLGPCFETPAEVAALRTLGVSYVGMSTVCEVIMAKALDMNVLGLTLAANESGAADVTHDSVRGAAEAHSEDFERLVRGVLRML